MRAIRAAVAVVCSLSVAAGAVFVGGGSSPAQTVPPIETSIAPPAGPAPARLAWRRCPGLPRLECAKLRVPLDYAQPTGPTLTLALNRSRARSQGKRIGSLLINPGGPGGSGIGFTAQAAQLFGSRITDVFDLVGFDPRGVGQSSPLRCLDPAQLDRYFAADPSPDTPAEREEIFATSRAMADGCLARNGAAVLRHVSTMDAARDIEQIRRALGEEKISFFGFSYGTLLGATYADLFPQRVRAFALDGALDPTATNDDRARLQAKGFEVALRNFTADCAQRPVCNRNLGGDPAAAVDAMFAKVERAPFVLGRRKVGPSEFTIAVISTLYSRRYGWPRLEQAMVSARSGDAAPILTLFDSYADRNADGTYRNTNEANAAINCVDVPSERDLAHYDALAVELGAVAPHFGAVTAYYNVVCGVWRVPAVDRPRPLSAVGAAPILVVGTTEDPATPFVWAEGLAAQLRTGVLLTVAGQSHTAYLSGGSCVRSAVENYLVKLQVPARGARC